MICNKAQLADVFGVTERSLTSWESQGMPIESRPGRGISNQYDSAKCIEWRTQRVLNGERQLSPRERKDLAQAQLAELQLAREATLLLRADEISLGLSHMLVATRSHMERWPRRIYAKLKRNGVEFPLSDLVDFVNEGLNVLAENMPDFLCDDIAVLADLAYREGLFADRFDLDRLRDDCDDCDVSCDQAADTQDEDCPGSGIDALIDTDSSEAKNDG
jgi:phage terminase Nu1 subunit (DNA packaging protein)